MPLLDQSSIQIIQIIQRQTEAGICNPSSPLLHSYPSSSFPGSGARPTHRVQDIWLPLSARGKALDHLTSFNGKSWLQLTDLIQTAHGKNLKHFISYSFFYQQFLFFKVALKPNICMQFSHYFHRDFICVFGPPSNKKRGSSIGIN